MSLKDLGQWFSYFATHWSPGDLLPGSHPQILTNPACVTAWNSGFSKASRVTVLCTVVWQPLPYLTSASSYYWDLSSDSSPPHSLYSSPTGHHTGLHALPHTLQWWSRCFKAFSFAVPSAWNTPFKISMWPLPSLASDLCSNVNLSAKPFVGDLDLPPPRALIFFFSALMSTLPVTYLFMSLLNACPLPHQHKTYEDSALFSSLL